MIARARAALLAGAVSAACWRLRDRVPREQAFHRQNHRGETLTMWEGPAWVAGALAAATTLPARERAAMLVAVGGAGLLGGLDDLTEKGTAKGLKGHLGALRRGEVTTGAAKILGISASGLIAAYVLVAGGRPSREGQAAVARRLADVVVAGGVVAGSANLLNLFDLRPGRVLKIVLAGSPFILVGGPAGTVQATATAASLALIGPDLGEACMLGDCGANAAGALLGANLVIATASCPGGPWIRLALLSGLVGLTVASERISFTQVIESTPMLRELDAIGRRPAELR